jgi:Cullin family
MQLIEKDSGASSMLRDNKTDDLARLFSLYNACGTKAIEPIADIFRKHIEAEGMSLVKQVTDAFCAEGGNRKDVQNAETAFVQQIIELQARRSLCMHVAANDMSRFLALHLHTLQCVGCVMHLMAIVPHDGGGHTACNFAARTCRTSTCPS